MARDYKNRRTRKKNDASPGWVWGLGGLAVGLFVALAVYIYDRQHLPSKVPVANTAAIPSSAREAPEEPAAEKGKRFDFYDMLPRFEVVIPETEREVKNGREPAAAAAAADATYVLQAGSFQNYADADRMKAQLALIGLESQIQNVTIDERRWHRVRLGPYDDLDAAQRTRRKLREADFDALVLRVTD